MATNQPHRDACRRQHRVLGNFLAMEAWTRGVDCIVLSRADLEKFLNLERFKSARVNWLMADLKRWFPHQVPYYKAKAMSSISSLFLSRVPINTHLPKGKMTTVERIAGMKADAPRTAQISPQSERSSIPTEDEILSRLVVYAAGLAVPKGPVVRMKKLKKKK